LFSLEQLLAYSETSTETREAVSCTALITAIHALIFFVHQEHDNVRYLGEKITQLHYDGTYWYIKPIVHNSPVDTLDHAENSFFKFFSGKMAAWTTVAHDVFFSPPQVTPVEYLVESKPPSPTPVMLEKIRAYQKEDLAQLGRILTRHLTPERLGADEVAHRLYALFIAMRETWCVQLETIVQLFSFVQSQPAESNILLFPEAVKVSITKFRVDSLYEGAKELSALQIAEYRFRIMECEYDINERLKTSEDFNYITDYKLKRTLVINYTPYAPPITPEKKREIKRARQSVVDKTLPFSIYKLGNIYHFVLEKMVQGELGKKRYDILRTIDLATNDHYVIKLLKVRREDIDDFSVKMAMMEHEAYMVRKFSERSDSYVKGGHYYLRHCKNGLIKHCSDMTYFGQNLHNWYMNPDKLLNGWSLWSKNERLDLMKKIVEVVCDFHERYGAHRDLKLENMGIDEQGTIRLFDLESAAKKGEEYLIRGHGSPTYDPPEYVKRGGWENLTMAGDYYSLGVLITLILSGYLWIKYKPIDGERRTDLEERRRQLGILRGYVKEMYAHTTVLLDKMLSEDPKNRPNTQEVRELFSKVNLRRQFRQTKAF